MFAAGQAGTGARTLVTGEALVPNVQFYLATRTFATQGAKAVDALIATLDEVDKKTANDTEAAAAELSAAIHVPASITATVLKR